MKTTKVTIVVPSKTSSRRISRVGGLSPAAGRSPTPRGTERNEGLDVRKALLLPVSALSKS